MKTPQILTNIIKNMHLRRAMTLGGILAVVSCFNILGQPQTAQAAEKVVLTYGQFGRSITIDELEDFVKTGRKTPTLRFLLKATKQDSDQVRQLLQREVTVSPKLLDNILNILPGEYLLFQAGRVFHTPARLSNDKALRSSIILSTVDDRKISVLEFLRKYPTREFYVDGYRLANTATDVVKFVNRVGDQFEAPIAIATDILQEFACDCNSSGQDGQ